LALLEIAGLIFGDWEHQRMNEGSGRKIWESERWNRKLM
jgi:hypothetical protein